jgi:hypothetical protein
MSMILPVRIQFRQAPAQIGAGGVAHYHRAKFAGSVTYMAGALSRFPAWFSQTVTLPLLPGLFPRETDRVFSSAGQGWDFNEMKHEACLRA